MHLIHKGKSRTTLDNYRGISVGSSIGQIFTKIWKERLEKIVENENYLGEIQGGFRKGKEVLENVFILNTLIERAQKRRKPLLVALIDIRKAFDTVNKR